MTSATDKGGLLFDGELHVRRWCKLNDVEPPVIGVNWVDVAPFDTCAFYRSGQIYIWPKACAAIGRAGRMWSYPGYVVDRTPYGVLAHELGHHVEKAHGERGGIFAKVWRHRTQEASLTGYCPNDNEWFAEIFRLFVTNPSLLSQLRPMTYTLMAKRWKVLAEIRPWTEVLAGAPRQIAAAWNKIENLR